ncbi:hypothetical protein M8J77_022401 [Diaphorina citri]|nr:hypothetical protein M8J77_022401 [Diaphorina citri]
MQTLSVYMKGNQEQLKKVRVLIDTGSQKSYVLTKTARELGYEPVKKEKVQHALFGGLVTSPTDHDVYLLEVSNLDLSFTCRIEALDQTKICGNVSTVPEGSWLEELKAEGIEISDVGSSTDIDILLGSDIAGKLWSGKCVQLKSGLVAMETHLGWTLSGKLPISTTMLSDNIATVVTNLYVKEANITDLWTLDVLGIKDPTENASKHDIERITQEHFLSTVRVNEDNRFEIHLPWLENHPPLGENYLLALKRLQSTVKKLKKDNYYNDYKKVLDNWTKAGVIEEVPEVDYHSTKGKHYLPHHAIIKPHSTTPVRPVFDASAREPGKFSLNDCLSKGPNLIEKIPASLAKFRKGRIGISGDIEKAFLQISVCPSDRDFLRFLWEDEDGIVKIYRHCRVVFGVSSSPFLLEAVLKLHLESTLTDCREGKLSWPINLVELCSFYVDNCLVSTDSQTEAEQFTKIASSIMQEKNFNLRGWELSGEVDGNTPNILGLVWDKETDTLSINIESVQSMKFEKITKKVILSAAHRIFDPIGIISGVALIPKLLVQETWRQNLSWTEEVDEETKAKFLQWLKEIPLLTEVCIPRWISGPDLVGEEYQIHVFADASKDAYATAIFLRIEHNQGVILRLLASKARVAPATKTSKRMSIPRLELLAACIAARLYQNVINDYKLHNVKTICWTDASTVLAWLQRHEPWDIYVMNRVKEIRELTKNCEWRHVPGIMNPADLPSRGSSVKKLIQLRWWEGPAWLKDSPETWPQTEVNYDEEEVNRERKKTVVSSMIDTHTDVEKDWYYKRFSSYKKTVRTIAWMLRFKHNTLCKDQRLQGELTAQEFKIAEDKVLLLVQREAFLDLSDPKLISLLPFLDECGLARIKTKVSNLPDSIDFCYPIVLPNSKHPVVHRLILEEHKGNLHAGTQTLLALLRRRFWILGGRRSVNHALNDCLTCKKHKVKRLEVVPTPLPLDRVRQANVFEVTGVDLAGPLYIKEEGGTKKVWICLFTCAIYRAVRLELVSNISTLGFLQALRRFASRQGRPSIMYSDCGTNFTGFDNLCAQLDWDMIANYSSARRIEWRFNPPTAPWWGGWWERLIGLMKNLLRRVLGRTSVNYVELQTLLCEVESVINARPLTYVSNNATDLSCITPSMFLHDLEDTGVPEYDFITSSDLSKKLKHSQQVKKQLHKRFVAEYLGQLQLFASKGKKHDLKLGDLVLVGDDHSKRIQWPLGRVVHLVPGKDGEIRVAHVHTANGTIVRPVQRLYLLESDPSYETGNEPDSNLASDMQPDEMSDVQQRLQGTPDLQSDDDSNDGEFSTSKTADPQSGRNLDRPSSPSVVHHPITNVDPEPDETIPIPQYHLNRRGRMIRKPNRFL